MSSYVGPCPKTHNLMELGRALDAPEDALSDLRLINPEYAASRDPDAANGIPAENYDQRKATMLREAAERRARMTIGFAGITPLLRLSNLAQGLLGVVLHA